MENKLTQKSYNKAKTVRKLFRDEMFEKSRKSSVGAASSYLNSYDQASRDCIRVSLEGPVPNPLPPLSAVTRETISYYRRSAKPVFKLRPTPDEPLDPHMTFESLWCLAGIEDIEQYPNSQRVVKQFQDTLPMFLATPYPQIKEMAIIAAGNKILGAETDIIRIANEDENQLWVLINHVYDRKINFEVMYKYLKQDLSIIYRTIYEMTNNQKDEIIESILKKEEILGCIVDSINNPNPEIQLSCVRIIGNILAERDDHSEALMRYQLLSRLDPLFKSPSPELKKDLLWLLSNYICESGPANELLCRPHILEKILIYYTSHNPPKLKVELYHVLAYLVHFGDSSAMYKLALRERLLEQCLQDIEIENQELTLMVVGLICRLVKLGEEYVSESDGVNPFVHFIASSRLKTYINAKTFSQNEEISNISFDILDVVEEYRGRMDVEDAMS